MNSADMTPASISGNSGNAVEGQAANRRSRVPLPRARAPNSPPSTSPRPANDVGGGCGAWRPRCWSGPSSVPCSCRPPTCCSSRGRCAHREPDRDRRGQVVRRRERCALRHRVRRPGHPVRPPAGEPRRCGGDPHPGGDLRHAVAVTPARRSTSRRWTSRSSWPPVRRSEVPRLRRRVHRRRRPSDPGAARKTRPTGTFGPGMSSSRSTDPVALPADLRDRPRRPRTRRRGDGHRHPTGSRPVSRRHPGPSAGPGGGSAGPRPGRGRSRPGRHGRQRAAGVAAASTPPVKVDIDSGTVTGPSAGLAWSLGIIDRLTPGALAGARVTWP